ncbi:MAG: M20 family metallopeptidase [Rhabdochlamydiaceae bacterium]|nr:M20 family metallopeptidase [Candidatus Amphrikana amoebophyrae]
MFSAAAIDIDLVSLAKQQQEYARNIRRHLHQYPELGWEENQTIAYLLSEIATFSVDHRYELTIHEKVGGFFVDLDIDSSFERDLFRADLDALPIEENSGLLFSSKVKGVMHACGHDFHAAMLLAALKVIVSGELPVTKNLRFVFQRAEEVGSNRSGGKTLVHEGVCADISQVYALHISSIFDCGTFYARENEALANNATISFSIECQGGHVMSPNLGSNAIDIQTEITSALRGFESRFFPPTEVVAFVPTFSSAGIAQNIRPNQLTMSYAFRNFLRTDKKRAFIKAAYKKIEHIVSGFEDASLTSFETTKGYPTLSNDRDSIVHVKNRLQQINQHIETSPLLFAGEDFSYYLQQASGSYWILGAKTGKGQDHHTSSFNPSEEVLWQGIAFWLSLA